MLAHQLGTAKLTPAKFLTRFAGARCNFDRFAAQQVAVESSGGPEATLRAFRAAEPRETAPPGPKDTWLGEVLVHGEDIRRPLREVARAIRFYARSNTIIGGKAGWRVSPCGRPTRT